MSRKYALPLFLEGRIDQQAYLKWLTAKTNAHFKRDRKRGNAESTRENYRVAIHDAVVKSQGRDAYTGEPLRWDLISTYNNAQSKQHGRGYKSGFALLPTVDHVGDGTGPAEFVICAWRTNDSKSDLTLAELVDLCRKILVHHGYAIAPPAETTR
ncbi:MAG: hypothetical protein SFV21_19705 [Rhodospirillaceae bacterium]|nr:hypothetical protein [Rhodospirillaceae bacterium]